MKSFEKDPIKHLIRTRFLVVGSGIAGLWTALHLHKLGEVTLITKSAMRESNTEYAQGGIAVALLPADSPDLHKQDTLMAGDGLCDAPAVEILTREGPAAVRELISIGAQFDQRDGQLVVGREAAHGRHRIIHAQGDATGAEVQRAASDAVMAAPGITVLEHVAVTDIVLLQGKCVGMDTLNRQTGEQIRILASATMMATGGVGNLFRVTTNPPVATGDGFAVAWRAGAAMQDMEFVQFHPTALADSSSPRFLISEAVRGEGAILRNCENEPFMEQYAPELRDLAPRDTVARAVLAEMQRLDTDSVDLDLSPIGDIATIEARFPGITTELRRRGIWNDGLRIPVTPAAHYMMGGIRSDVNGQTSVPGLYACGEAASCGVHGANRLASNSLLDGLVFGMRSARAMASDPDLTDAEAASAQNLPLRSPAGTRPEIRDLIRDLMWENVGLLRCAKGLGVVAAELENAIGRIERKPDFTPDTVEAAAMVLSARLITTAAQERQESRGAHYRVDFPEQSAQWRQHTILRRGFGGEIIASRSPVLD